MATTDKDLYSMGALAEHFEIPLRQLQLTIQRAGIQPALRLNGLAYYDSQGVERELAPAEATPAQR